jgi:hypothetical protein
MARYPSTPTITLNTEAGTCTYANPAWVNNSQQDDTVLVFSLDKNKVPFAKWGDASFSITVFPTLWRQDNPGVSACIRSLMTRHRKGFITPSQSIPLHLQGADGLDQHYPESNDNAVLPSHSVVVTSFTAQGLTDQVMLKVEMPFQVSRVISVSLTINNARAGAGAVAMDEGEFELEDDGVEVVEGSECTLADEGLEVVDFTLEHDGVEVMH